MIEEIERQRRQRDRETDEDRQRDRWRQTERQQRQNDREATVSLGLPSSLSLCLSIILSLNHSVFICLSVSLSSLSLNLFNPYLVLLIEEVHSAMLYNDRNREDEELGDKRINHCLWVHVDLIRLYSYHCITSRNELLQLIILDKDRDGDRE